MAGQWAISGCKEMDLLWKQFFRDPSQWWDNRNDKTNSRFPDFKHKMTEESLWVYGPHVPSWVQEALRRQEVEDGIGCERREAQEVDYKPHRDSNVNQQSLVALLKTCAKQKDLHKGTRLHGDILKSGLLGKDIYIGTALVNMYAKCGALAKAREVFDKLHSRDVISWNALIAGYSQNGHGEEALRCFELMQQEGLYPNAVTFTCILKACGSIGATEKGEEIHAEVLKQGLVAKKIALGTALVDMYAKCGALLKAQEVFDELPVQDLVSWNALIAGYAQHGHGDKALNCLDQMQDEGILPDAVTFTCILKACGSVGAAEQGEVIHAEVVRQGLLKKDIMLGSALVDMYAKCGALAKAQEVFDELPVRNVVCWNALIAGYVQHGYGDKALNFFERLQQEGLSPDAVTFICVLKACGSIGAVEMGERIHAEVARQGLLEKALMVGNALVDMYAKCGILAKARKVFDELPVRNVVSWSALIAGYAQHGYGAEALDCFEQMQEEGLPPNAITLTSTLKACGSIGAAEKGEVIHAEVVRQGLLENDIILGTALVDMYVKCGALAKAQEVFDELPVQSVVSWNALIAGCAQHGHGDEAVNYFEQMQLQSLTPNAVTFTVLLNACSHSGLVNEGQRYFVLMSTHYGLIPTFEHHACMVDLFGRAGYLDKALRVIEKMPPTGCHLLWSALLAACQKWGNVKLGELAFEHVVQFAVKDAAAYVCMASIYVAAGMQEEAAKVESMRVKNEAWKMHR